MQKRTLVEGWIFPPQYPHNAPVIPVVTDGLTDRQQNDVLSVSQWFLKTLH